MDLPGLRRQVLLQEVAEAALADKADAGGIFLFRGDQLVSPGDVAHFGLGNGAHGEQGLLQLGMAHRVQEVALVLVVVQSLQQRALALAFTAARIVAGGDEIGAQLPGVLQEGLELDFAIAQDVWVGRAAGAVFRQEMLEHVVPVLGGEVGAVQGDAQAVGHRPGIGEILFRGAVLGAVVFLPVLHEQAFHAVALLPQQQCRHGGVHAAGHTDDHFAGRVQAHWL